MTRNQRLWLGLTLATSFAVSLVLIYSWGRATQAAYEIVSGPASLSAPNSQWTIERQGAKEGPWIARDNDGDGTWDEFETPERRFARPGPQSPPNRWLVVCLDGVPLRVMQSFWDHGHFREFFRPTAVVSTFPSDTETALTEALHAAPASGYENLFFDRAGNRMRGGAWITLSGSGIPYIRSLDYDTPGWAKALPYLLPGKTYRADVERFRLRMLASSAPVLRAHIAASDAVLHVENLNEAGPLLLEFEGALRQLYLDAHGSLGVIVFSDHGNTELTSRPVPIENFLTAHGWRVRKSLEGERDVIIPAYGLLGFAALYCQPESIEELAEALRGIEGVDLVLSHHHGTDSVTIRSTKPGESADLQWLADGSGYRYIARGGDPMGLAAIFNGLRVAGKLDRNGFASDSDLFALTASGPYPDVAARIRGWATNHIRNPAEIMVSLKPGNFHGAAIFGHIVNLASTHGGLESTSSLGFAMGTYPLAPTVRLADLLPSNLVQPKP